MTEIGTATVPPRDRGQDQACRVGHWPDQVALIRRATRRAGGSPVKASGGILAAMLHPIAVVRRQFPVPILGLLEIPAVVRRPFPVACVAQMETTSHA